MMGGVGVILWSTIHSGHWTRVRLSG
jgi:hypothetical protein